MRRREFRFVVFICIVIILLVALPKNAALRVIYPLRYKELVIAESIRHNMDPLLLAAVAKVESNYDAAARSHKGALGLMQIMPETGGWVAEKLALDNWSTQMLMQPGVNIKVGAWYLDYLIDSFHGDIAPALAAYNGGLNNVRRWLAADVWDGSSKNYQQIPFPETRQYLWRVIHAYEWYQRAYPELAVNSLEDLS